MSLFTVGRLCVKIAGRDAGRTCVVVESAGDRFVVVDGDVRRKKVNVLHLEPLEQIIELKSNASHEDVKKAFVTLSLPVWETKPKKVGAKPLVQRTVKKVVEKKEKAPKAAKKEAVKETKQ